MNIIISPAKKMNVNNDDLVYEYKPVFMDKTNTIYEKLKSLSYDDLKKLLACNDDIAGLNYDRYKYMDLDRNLSPAILTYEGLQYKYMSPNCFSTEEFDYIKSHLKILSGFYGVLNPFDGVVPYRLEMQAKLNVENSKNLYEFWGDSIYRELRKESNIILNLASKEYSKCIEKYLSEDDIFITCVFGELKDDGKIKVKATEAKMARGLMVRYMASNNITNIEDIKKFSDLSFKYSREYSTDKEFVFLK
ncbi:MAG: peroxide stress protein YaaA [Clostridium sp.]|nr:peroxide stress protein YaaA [Clostridium sp.]